MKTTHTSYGIIPVCKKDEQCYICCVKNHKSGEWGLPKGTPENDETPLETATRELKEETGIKEIEISEYPMLEERYTFEREGSTHSKTVEYFISFVSEMIVETENLDGIDEVRWIKIEDSDKLFKFQDLINLTRKLKEILLKFPLTSTYRDRLGETVVFEYYEADSIKHLPKEQLSQVQIMAFHKDRLLIVNNITKPGMYGPVGGGIEPGETPEECLPRELQEESNMRVIKSRLIGYQRCISLSHPEKPTDYQLRYFARVEPIGPFTPDCDPDGDVTELLEIDPKDYKKYFDWGEIGDAIVDRALGFLEK